ncbi:MAG: glycosyltransferase, partial [Flavobacteriaceae bacterium]
MNPLEISVIVSTYNAEEWLEKVLWGFEFQTYRNFELIIADDGSGPKTKLLIDDLSQKLGYPMVHVWQEDEGFQKSRILNKALKACRGNYVVMTDGDCIPRPDFLQVHYDRSKPGHFLSGGYFMLPMTTSKAIQIADITSSICFNPPWLKENGVPSSRKNLKLTATGKWADFLNWITPTKATWNGH